ncbi:putative phage protein gp47/JayE [Neisseria sp. HSC-16F19]|nr:baseplate J/gp47 family protein [Neisseria sp. HSC-16F19]MCP2041790.1 putative phage protein gp47/JayE [Neisseria sp. HSC-16F19]
MKNFEEIRADYLRDLQNRVPAAHVHPGSDNHARATALAALAEGQYRHQEWVLRQAFADTADSAYLEKHAAIYRIVRKPGVAASGSVRISGRPGTVLPAGLTLSCGDSLYRTADGVLIGPGGSADVVCHAVAVGTAHNQADNSAALLQSAPAGADSAAVLLSAAGGTDAEDDAALLARLLDHLRRPPAGGNAHDYYRWAMEVPGVTRAFVYPLRRGLGTVDIAILAQAGLPGPGVVAAVQDYIDERRPVTAKNALVLAPTAVRVDVQAQVRLLPGAVLAEVTAAVRTMLEAYFARLQPGETVYRSQIEGLISQAAGVQDRIVSAPAANVAATVTPELQWAVLGDVELTAV